MKMVGSERAKYDDKIWGKTSLVVKRPGFTVHHLMIVPGSYCSIHLHQHRFNGFFVTKGSITVREFSGDAVAKEVALGAGDYYEVAPGIKHQFESIEGAEALEIYFPPDVNENDITRFSIGNLLSQSAR
jgi:mannose-6-phosphate isomerase-like protein (cupin superfamily)